MTEKKKFDDGILEIINPDSHRNLQSFFKEEKDSSAKDHAVSDAEEGTSFNLNFCNPQCGPDTECTPDMISLTDESKESIALFKGHSDR